MPFHRLRAMAHLAVTFTSSCRLYGTKTIEELVECLNCDTFLIDQQRLLKLRDDAHKYTEKGVIVDDLTDKIRPCEAPTKALKQFQRRLHDILLAWLMLNKPDYLHSFSFPLDNAKAHAGQRMTVTMDVRKFFRNTKRPPVYDFFFNVMGMSKEVATLLTDLCVYKGHLPTGGPTSPILSFLAYWEMWDQIARVSPKNGVFTLYIDNLTISAHRLSQAPFRKIKEVLGRYGFSTARSKQGWFAAGKAKDITGIVVKLDGTCVVPYRTQERLNKRIIQHQKAKTRKERKLRAQQIKGLQDWILMVGGVELSNQREIKKLPVMKYLKALRHATKGQRKQ